MGLKGKACIAGAFEHPTRKAPDKSVALLHAECARGALADAGLTKDDVDGYFCAGDAPGMGPLSMVDYLNLKVRHVDATDIGGASYLVLVAHAAEAIAAGRCNVALITLAGRPRSEGMAIGTAPRAGNPAQPDLQFEFPYAPTIVNMYAMCAQRHMHEYGTTSEQLAWIKVAASQHAQFNEHAMLRDVVTVEQVLESPIVASPLHRLDCCVITDGGGALVVVKPEIARSLQRPLVSVTGAGEAVKGQSGGEVDLTYTAARWSGPAAFAMAATAVRGGTSRGRGSRPLRARRLRRSRCAARRRASRRSRRSPHHRRRAHPRAGSAIARQAIRRDAPARTRPLRTPRPASAVRRLREETIGWRGGKHSGRGASGVPSWQVVAPRSMAARSSPRL